MNIYHDNIQKYNTTTLKLAKVLKRLSTLRLIAFLFSIAIIFILANERLVTLLLIAIPFFALSFGFLVRRYNQIADQKRHYTYLREVNESEVLKLKNKLVGQPIESNLINRDHPYASDLDIFGSHSLFQLINRTTTESGSICLAEWLSKSGTKKIIIERQKAIKELTPKLNWRQYFQASGLRFKNAKSDYSKLLSWIEKPVQLLEHQSKYLIISIFLSILSTCALLYFFIHLVHFILAIHGFTFEYVAPLIIALAINYFVLQKVRPMAEDIIEDTRHNLKILGGYESLIIEIESEKFRSRILKQLQSKLNHISYSAASEIHKLKGILTVFHLRGLNKEALSSSFFYSVFNMLWLFDVYWIILTEKWKVRNGPYLKSWASAVSEFEVLNSLAGFAYSNPSFTFPEIMDESYTVHFEMVGHPLVSSESRVYNDFDFKGRGQTAIITGSNMAGKSTFLRTIGINIVLGLMGAPCCAKSGQISQLKIFTSMRTEDNLKEGVSSFYAELKRIEQLLKIIENEEAVFFLLDEMFKGTNSKDRHKGGFSLIKQLKELNTFGIISTHDLELAILAEQHKLVVSYSFNSEIKDSEMIFNYKLTEGICKDFNASELMKKSGIKILPNMEID